MKTKGRVRIKDIDIQNALEKYHLAQAGINIGLDDLSLVEADIIRFIKTKMDEETQKKLEKQTSQMNRGI